MAGRSDTNAGISSAAPWATFDKVKIEWTNSITAGDTIYLERGSVFGIAMDGDWYMLAEGSAGNPITLTGVGYGTGAMPIVRRTSGGGLAYQMCRIRASYITIEGIEWDGGHDSYGLDTAGIIVMSESTDTALSNVIIKDNYIHNLGGISGNENSYICGIWLKCYAPDEHEEDGLDISDCLISGNTVSDYNAHGLNHYSSSEGVLRNIIWRNNISTNSYPVGDRHGANSAFQFSTPSEGMIFEHNYLSDTTAYEGGNIYAFTKWGDHEGAADIFRYNIISDSMRYGIGIWKDQTGPFLMQMEFYGNIIEGNAKEGLRYDDDNCYKSGSYVKFYNNTFYGNAHTTGGDLGGEDTGVVHFYDQSSTTTFTFVNNIIYHQELGVISALAFNASYTGTFVHNNNLYYYDGPTANTVIYSESGTKYTLANVTSYEPTAQNTDPDFYAVGSLPTSCSSTAGVSPDGLLPNSGSPVQNNGASGIGSIDIDLTSTPYGTYWDIGAYEIAEGATPPDPPDPTSTNVVTVGVNSIRVQYRHDYDYEDITPASGEIIRILGDEGNLRMGDGVTAGGNRVGKDLSYYNRTGWQYWDDSSSNSVALTVADTFYKLENDGEGSFSQTNFKLNSNGYIWNTTTNMFDLSDLNVGDTIDLRLGYTVTTSGAARDIITQLVLGVGGTESSLPNQTTYKTAGSYSVLKYFGIYIGDENIRTNGAYFAVSSDGTGDSVIVDGFYIRTSSFPD